MNENERQILFRYKLVAKTHRFAYGMKATFLLYARCGVLWSRGYFISTVGHISEATVIKYIEEQKNDK